MKLSWKWLSEFVPLKGLEPEAIGEKLTIHTAELEETIETPEGDTLFDIDNKSLTHRPDLMGHRGFARELATIFESKLILPEPLVSVPDSLSPLPVKIESDRCRRFCGIRLDGVTVGASAPEVQTRLSDLDINSISNFVDITNWIMLEYGQPMHVFDADKIEGTIVVRQAKAGEKIVTLDNQELELSEEDIVIADEVKVLSVAGVMGGLESSVTAQTKNVIFEAANFDPTSIRKTSQRLGLRSDSSMRFEKSLDPHQCKRAAFAAVEIAQEICPKSVLGSACGDEFPQIPKSQVIDFSLERLKIVSGVTIPEPRVVKILTDLGFGVSGKSDVLKVTVPSFRATKDVSIEEDLIEEIVRIHGIFRIEASLPVLPTNPPRTNKLRRLEWEVRDTLANLGFLETYNYGFVNKADEAFIGKTDHITIENPLSSDHTHLRQTLVSNALTGVESELRTHESVAYFEIGRVYFPDEKLPAREVDRALMVSASTKASETDLFYALKQKLEQFFSLLKLELDFRPFSEPQAPYIHPVKSAEILLNGEAIGVISSLHPVHKPFKKGSLVFAEFDLAPVLSSRLDQQTLYTPASAFPSVHRDVSIVLAEKILVSDLIKTAKKSHKLLKAMVLFDEYRDAQKLGEGLKNLAFHLEFQSKTKTLDETEIDQAFESVLSELRHQFEFQLRMEFDQQNQKNS